MKNIVVNDLNFCQTQNIKEKTILGGTSVQKAPTFSASTKVSLKTKVIFGANINYKTGAEYSGSAGYAGGYAAGASINGNSVAFINASVQ